MPPRSIPGFHEPFNAISHLAGALVFALLSIWLIRSARGEAWRVVTYAVYAFGTVFLLSMSGVYHMLAEGSPARSVLGRLDLAGIFLLIVSTHTPVQAMFFRGAARRLVLAVMWAIAIIGIVLFSVFYGSLAGGLKNGTFLALGWIAGTFGLIIWKRFGWRRVRLLVLGGLVYTIGAIILGLERPTLIPGVFGSHEIWHIAVIVALTLHWRFLFQNAHLQLGGLAPHHLDPAV